MDLPRHAWDTPPFLLIGSPIPPAQSVDAYVRSITWQPNEKRLNIFHEYVALSRAREPRYKLTKQHLFFFLNSIDTFQLFTKRDIPYLNVSQSHYLKNSYFLHYSPKKTFIHLHGYILSLTRKNNWNGDASISVHVACITSIIAEVSFISDSYVPGSITEFAASVDVSPRHTWRWLSRYIAEQTDSLGFCDRQIVQRSNWCRDW